MQFFGVELFVYRLKVQVMHSSRQMLDAASDGGVQSSVEINERVRGPELLLRKQPGQCIS
jgi:hypothetical protein